VPPPLGLRFGAVDALRRFRSRRRREIHAIIARTGRQVEPAHWPFGFYRPQHGQVMFGDRDITI